MSGVLGWRYRVVTKAFYSLDFLLATRTTRRYSIMLIPAQIAFNFIFVFTFQILMATSADATGRRFRGARVRVMLERETTEALTDRHIVFFIYEFWRNVKIPDINPIAKGMRSFILC